MTPKLANKAFLAKSTQYMRLERHKEPYNIGSMDSQTTYMYVAAREIADTQNDYRNPRACTEG
jgi:hypothetical protein